MSGSHVTGEALLPVRVEPVAGEAIDSWLEATARSMDMTLSALVRRLHLPGASCPPWLVRLSWDQFREIERATGVLPHVTESMTLADYDDRALQILALSHRLDTTFPYGPLSWSRNCSWVLAESGGRWQLIWRLGWSFACIQHHCVLVDCCPDCGERPRRYQVYNSVPRPMLCRCGRSLETAIALESSRAFSNDPIVEAQRQIVDVLTTAHASFGVFADTPSMREGRWMSSGVRPTGPELCIGTWAAVGDGGRLVPWADRLNRVGQQPFLPQSGQRPTRRHRCGQLRLQSA